MKAFNVFMTCLATFLGIHLVLWTFGVPPLWGVLDEPRSFVLLAMHLGTFVYVAARAGWNA